MSELSWWKRLFSRNEKPVTPTLLPNYSPTQHDNDHFDPKTYLEEITTLRKQLGLHHLPLPSAPAAQSNKPSLDSVTNTSLADTQVSVQHHDTSQNTQQLDLLRERLGISKPKQTIAALHEQLREQANTDADDLAAQYEAEQSVLDDENDAVTASSTWAEGEEHPRPKPEVFAADETTFFGVHENVPPPALESVVFLQPQQNLNLTPTSSSWTETTSSPTIPSLASPAPQPELYHTPEERISERIHQIDDLLHDLEYSEQDLVEQLHTRIKYCQEAIIHNDILHAKQHYNTLNKLFYQLSEDSVHRKKCYPLLKQLYQNITAAQHNQ